MIYKVSNLKKIKIYMNRYPYKTAEEIKKELDCDLIFNGQFFNMKDGSPCQTLKVDGEILSYEGVDYTGFGWNGDGSEGLIWTNDRFAVDNLMTCNALLRNGQKLSLDGLPENTKRGKMAMGTGGGCLYVFGAQDGTEDICTLNTLQDHFLKLGCTHAMALDGGGSVTLLGNKGCLEQKRFPLYIFVCVWGDIEELPRSVLGDDGKTIYRVQCGAFVKQASAVAYRDKIRALDDNIGAGYANAYVRKVGLFYKVQVGAYSKIESAQRVQADLQGMGVSAFIAKE